MIVTVIIINIIINIIMKVKEGAGFIWEKTSRLNLTYHIGLWDQANIFYIWDHVFIFGIVFSYLGSCFHILDHVFIFGARQS